MSNFWKAERDEFKAFLQAHPGSSYIDWQPTKWQSHIVLKRHLLDETTKAGHPVRSALELGCGSATLLLLLASEGVSVVGVDREAPALELATLAAESLPEKENMTGRVAFRQLDFFNHGAMSKLQMADVVLSIGVIEHFPEELQRSLLGLHASWTQRWVLIGIPNMESPVFRSFIHYRERLDRSYEEDHEVINVPRLAETLGYKITAHDGCQVFLRDAESLNRDDKELLHFYEGLRTPLMSIGGARYAAFPHMDLTSSDIDALVKVESECPAEIRQRFGFLLWYLVDTWEEQ